MPRSRGSEISQARQSPRAPLHLKPTACSEANSVHRHSSDRSPKLDDRRSPRSPLHEKKMASRVADLETKLGQAQEELKKLKEQLTAAEDARRDAQMELENTKKLFPDSPLTMAVPDLEDEKEKTMNVEEDKVGDEELSVLEEGVGLNPEEDTVNCPTTDVFEVAPANGDGEGSMPLEEDVGEGTETKVVIEEEKSKEEIEIGEREEEGEVESPEMSELRALLSEKENQLERVAIENRSLKKEAEDAKACSTAERKNAEELTAKLAGAEEELNEIKMAAETLREKLEREETAKAPLEAEMKCLRIQTEQWRKAAEAAAAVLAAADGAIQNDADVNGRKLGESCRSMEKHSRGYAISMGDGGGSPAIAGAEGDDGIVEAKRRSGGGRIRVLGELWKKKGQMK